jgi:hypothetical protein
MSDPILPSFRYRLEQQPSRTGSGGLVRGASVRQFPVSKGIAGASLRLQPGSLRELHWHTTAAQWAETFKDFPPVQKPNSFTLDDALRMMHDCSRRGRKIEFWARCPR